MRLLLDTHVLLWWLIDTPELSKAARDAITRPDALVHVSAASVWEAGIKAALGRLDLNGVDLADEIEPNGFTELAISARHAAHAAALPRHHDDPFDRLLVAQADLDDLTLVTADTPLKRYDVDLLVV